MHRHASPPLVSPPLFLWLTVAATGGPLALTALYVPGILGDARGSAGLVVLLGLALFLPPLFVWLGFSRTVTGPGGLYSFVEAGLGRGAARVQAGLWVLSYALYLVYTTTYVAYDVLPAAFPAAGAYRPAVQLLTATVVAILGLLPIRGTLTAVAILAMGQVVLVGALVAVALGNQGGSGPGQGAPGSRGADVLVAGGNLSILFICAGLPLFLGGEAAGGSRTVRAGLSRGWAVAAVAVAVATVPMATVAPEVLNAPLPGTALVRSAGLPLLAALVGAGVAASVVGVMVAELLALSRLLHALTERDVGSVARVLAAVLVVGSTVTLVRPERAYEDLLKPSLIALWLSQLLVFVAYPVFVRRRRPGVTGALAGSLTLGAAASALMVFGLWSTTVNQLGT